MQKIIVTGSEGFVASRFLEYYKNKCILLPINRNTLDITNENDVYKFIKSANADYVFHAAGIADIAACEQNPELADKTNVEATINIAKACENTGSTLVFCSTDQIYRGNTGMDAYTEDDEPVPLCVYARGKLKAEREIAGMTERYYSLRLSWMFSYIEENKKTSANFLLNIINSIKNNKAIYLSDSEYRCITYVYEVIKNFEKIIHIPYGVYNAGSENNLSMYELGLKTMDYLNAAAGTDSIIKEKCDSETEPLNLSMSNKKLRNLGIEFLSSEKGIKKCINDYKSEIFKVLSK